MTDAPQQPNARLDLRLAEKVGLWALALWLTATAGLLSISPRAAAGLALGGGLTLAFLALHLALARTCLSSTRRRWARAYLWMVWLVKWPAIGVSLWFALHTGWASPLWLCAGAGLVPLVATAITLTSRGLGRSETAA